MPKKPISDTVKERLPRAERESPGYRREAAIRELGRKYGERGDPLKALARILAEASDPKLQMDAAKALAPFMYPSLKAVEVTGANGDALSVTIKVSSSAPVLSPGSESAPVTESAVERPATQGL